MTCHSDTAQLALDTLLQKPMRGIPAWLINPMEWEMIDRLAGAAPGAYRRCRDCSTWGYTAFRAFSMRMVDLPAERWSSVTVSCANFHGRRRATGVNVVPIRIRRVVMAIAANVTQGSSSGTR